jgi:hypothetical protein
VLEFKATEEIAPRCSGETNTPRAADLAQILFIALHPMSFGLTANTPQQLAATYSCWPCINVVDMTKQVNRHQAVRHLQVWTFAV